MSRLTGGDRFILELLAELGQLARLSIVHELMRRSRQRDEVPILPGVLGIVTAWVDVMHPRSLDVSTVALSVLAEVTVPLEDVRPLFFPTRRLIIKHTHPMPCADAVPRSLY